MHDFDGKIRNSDKEGSTARILGNAIWRFWRASATYPSLAWTPVALRRPFLATMSHSPADDHTKPFSKQKGSEKDRTLTQWEDAFLSSGQDLKGVMTYFFYHTKQGKLHRLAVIDGLRKSFQEKQPKHEKNLAQLIENLNGLYVSYQTEAEKLRLLELLVTVISKQELEQRGMEVSKELWDKARKQLRENMAAAAAAAAPDGAPLVEVHLPDAEDDDLDAEMEVHVEDVPHLPAEQLYEALQEDGRPHPGHGLKRTHSEQQPHEQHHDHQAEAMDHHPEAEEQYPYAEEEQAEGDRVQGVAEANPEEVPEEAQQEHHEETHVEEALPEEEAEEDGEEGRRKRRKLEETA